MAQILRTIDDKEAKVFRIFDKSIKPCIPITLAYSGGKDSTVLAVLFYRWVKNRGINGLNLTLLHNDTLGEIDLMEKWTRKFMEEFKQRMAELGNGVTNFIATPPPVDTFYWRSLIRGYPAPSFNFRWCVKLLKMQPTQAAITNLGPGLVMTGLREFESRERAKLISRKYGACPLGPSKCLAYYFLARDDGSQRKVAPLRDWSNADAWDFMRGIEDFDISDLLYLYGCDEARYGCWHCTLARVQWGLHSLGKQYLYYDALRLLYRRISDVPSLRMRKKSGYSHMGALNGAGRSMLLNLMEIAEEKSRIPIYGLDETKVENYSLRQLLFTVKPEESMQVILRADPRLNKKRIVEICDMRDIQMHNKKTAPAIARILKLTKNDKSRIIALEKGFDPTRELLSELSARLQSPSRLDELSSKQ